MKIIALFFPALVSILIYVKRNNININFNIQLLIRYGIYAMAVNWCDMALTTYVFGISDSKLEYLENWSFFTKYVLIAVFFAWIIPYFEEVVRKYIHINFKIESRRINHEDNKEDN